MKKNYFLLLFSLFFGMTMQAQNIDVFNRSDSNTGDWGSGNNPWFYTGGGNGGDPDSNGTQRNYVKIDHNNFTTMTTNGRFYIFRTLDFLSTATSARTINNLGGGLSADQGIYNASTATHIINTPLGIDGGTVQIQANSSGGLSFTDNIFLNANTAEFGGSATGNISVSTGTISGSGNLTKTGSNTLTLSGTNSYTGITTVSGGTLVLNSSISSSDIIVNSGATLQISSNATINSLTVNSGGMVTVDSGIALTITNDLTLNSSSSMVVNGSLSVSGNANFLRSLAMGEQWYLMSSPVIGEMYDDTWNSANGIDTGANANNTGVSWYLNTTPDGTTGHWRYFQSGSSAGSFNVAQGYSIRKANTGGDITFTGSNIYTSTQTFSLTQNTNNYNLVGNPFTGSFNLGDFFTDNGGSVITGAQVWLWNGSSYDVKTSGVDGSFEIAPGQGFFVEAANETNLTFDYTHVSHTSSTFQKGTVRPEINLSISDNHSSRNARVLYIDGTSSGYDLGFDGKLFGGDSQSLALYTDLLQSDGKKYQVQSLPNQDFETMVIPVGVIAASGKEITFTAEAMNLPEGLKVFLEDRENNTFNELTTTSNYKVTLNTAVNGSGRFFLHTRSSALSTDDISLTGVGIYAVNKNTLRISGVNSSDASVKVYNILGRKVVDQNFSSKNVYDVSLPNLNTGVYIVQLSTEKGKISKKIVLE